MNSRNTITAAALLLLSGAAAVASPLTPEEALRRAMNEAPLRIAPSATDRYRLAETRMGGEAPALYVYEQDQGGFLVVTADDAVAPIAGYAPEAKLRDEAGRIAPQCEYWLGELARQTEYAASRAGSKRRAVGYERPERAEIEPMCKTRWNQREPYNYFCPKQGQEKVVTGCVATAMAQVMKYFNWPDVGEGSHTYMWSGRALTQDYSKTSYKWEDMLDEYDNTATKAQQMAVGQLMYGAGVSVDMNYSVNGSGAQSLRIPIALTSYFRYDRSMQYLERDFYLLPEWEDMLYRNLAEVGPVIYDGQGGEGGHSFVCDGYSSDGYFHFNWGWGGVSDGYFLIDLLDPIEQGIGGGESAFSYMQDCVLGIRPDRTGESKADPVLRMMSALYTDQTAATRDEEINWGGFVYNPGPCTIESVIVGMRFSAADGSMEQTVDLGGLEDLEPMYGFGELECAVPTELPDGNYRVSVVYQIGGEEDYSPERYRTVPVALTGVQGMMVEVAGDELRLSEIGPELPELYDMALPETAEVGETITVSGRIVNECDQATFTIVVPILLDSRGDLLTYGTFTPVDLEKGEEIAFETEMKLIGVRGPLAAGEYEVYLCGYGNPYFFPLAESKAITLTPSTEGVAEVAVENGAVATEVGLQGLPAGDGDRIRLRVVKTPEGGRAVVKTAR